MEFGLENNIKNKIKCIVNKDLTKGGERKESEKARKKERSNSPTP